MGIRNKILLVVGIICMIIGLPLGFLLFLGTTLAEYGEIEMSGVEILAAYVFMILSFGMAGAGYYMFKGARQ